MKRADGEGSVYYNEARQRWEAVGPSPGRIIRTGKTQAEAIRRRDLAMAKAGNVSLASSKQPLRDYLDGWLATKAADVSALTHDGYEIDIRKHIVPHIGDVRLGDLKPQHIQLVLNKAKSAWTRFKVHQRLKVALALAVKWKIISANPADEVQTPTTYTPPVVPLADEHFYTLLDAIKKDRLYALWLLFLTVGCRRGEAIALGRTSVDLDAARVLIVRSLQRVRGKLTFLPTKTKTGNRSLSLPAPVVEALRSHMVRQKEERLKAGVVWEDHGLVFSTRHGTPLEPRNVTRRWGQILHNANIPAKSLKDGTRHTVISILLREGADISAVQAMAGHAQKSTTLEVYGHLMSGPSVVADKMAAVLSRKKS